MQVVTCDEGAEAAIARWYRRTARATLAPLAARETERLGLSFASLKVRDTLTRWGSCSAKANLSFSWRLVLAPRDVLEYVVIHELCHLREPGHSRAFWRLVNAVQPGWQTQARWLREHGHELHAYSVRLS